MIEWSIEVAKNSNLFERVIVSTDDEEIAEVARRSGAEVPFMRPEELSSDYVGTIEVVSHATQWALKQGSEIEAVCCIYATAPFIQTDDLKRGWEIMNSGDWLYVFAVTEFPSSIFRSFKQGSNGGIEMFFPEYFLTRTQDLPEALHDAGQFYWGRTSAWLEGRRVLGSDSMGIVIPRWRAQDIDTKEDWHQAEILFRLNEVSQKNRI